jgi:hypothetical protein
MSARLLALICLLSVSPCLIRSESAAPAGDMVVYFSADSASSPAVLSEMKRELRALMQPGGFRIEWRDLRSGKRDAAASHVAVVEFKGVCGAPPGDASPGPVGNLPPLASTSVVEGHVLPFSSVDCTALSRFVGSSLGRESEAKRSRMYGRAVARLVAHEIYHIVTRTQEHTQAGIAKPRFTLGDLLSEHFEFEEAALARLRRPSGPSGGGYGDGDAPRQAGLRKP